MERDNLCSARLIFFFFAFNYICPLLKISEHILPWRHKNCFYKDILSHQSNLNFLFSLWQKEEHVWHIGVQSLFKSSRCGRFEKWESFTLCVPLSLCVCFALIKFHRRVAVVTWFLCSSSDPSARHWTVCSRPPLLVSECEDGLFVQRCDPLPTECVEQAPHGRRFSFYCPLPVPAGE